MKHRKSVFVVDDDPETLGTISLILKDTCALHLFPQADAHFFESLVQKPDIVLLDLITPLLNTPATVKYLRKHFGRSLKVYLMSGIKQRNIPILPVDGFLKKPFLVQDVRELIEGAVEMSPRYSG